MTTSTVSSFPRAVSRRPGTGLLAATFMAMLLLAGCDDSSSDSAGENVPPGGDNSSASVAGVAQKGPFQPGGTVTVTQLDADGTPGDNPVSGSLQANGAYSVDGLDWTGPTEVRIEGAFFNEISANFDQSRVLRAFLNASDAGAANVNLYTHFTAARIAHLMASGDSFADAQTQAREEIETLMGIESASTNLNLLDAAAGNEADGANLLLFSAALLKAGIDQAGIDAIAADFADDGIVNTEGSTTFAAIRQAASANSGLLDTARANLLNQYSKTPPAPAMTNLLAWQFIPCGPNEAEKFRVVCLDSPFYGNDVEDSEKFVTFIPREPGRYTIELYDDLSVADANTLRCSWALYTDREGRPLTGSGYGGDFCGVEAITGPLSAGRVYYVLPRVGPDDETKRAYFKLSMTKNSDGSDHPGGQMKLEVGETHEGVVGTWLTHSDRAYYQFDGGVGNYRITLSGYPCGSGAGQLAILLYDQADFDRSSSTSADETDACVQTLDVSLDGVATYYVVVENNLSGWNLKTHRPAPAGINFKLLIEPR